ADCETAASISSGNRKLSYGRSAAGRNEGPIGRIYGWRTAGSAAGGEQFVIADIELAEKPIEAEFPQIVLIILDKLRLDLDLFRSGGAGLFDDCVDEFKIVGGIADNQPAALRKKMRAR